MRQIRSFLNDTLDLSATTPVPEGQRIGERELKVSQNIPYTHMYDEVTGMTADNALVQVIKVDGLLFESLSDDQIKRFERQRNTVLRSISNSDRAVYVHLIRRKDNVFPGGTPKAWFARYFNDLLKTSFEKRKLFRNEIYITIVRNRFRRGAAGMLDRVAALFSGAKADQSREETFEDQARDLHEATSYVVKSLGDYNARLLGIVEKEGLVFNELEQFFDYLVNLQHRARIVTDRPMRESLATSRISFNSPYIEVDDGMGHRRVGAMLSMKEWPSRSRPKMLNNFLCLPVEMVITQSFFFTDNIKAQSEMRDQRGRLAKSGEPDEELIGQLGENIADVNAGRSVNGKHHLSFFVHVDATGNPEDVTKCLESDLETTNEAFNGLGVVATREDWFVETFFWSQLPGQKEQLIGRRGTIKSKNFAGFANLHNYAVGRYSGNLWGDCITVFPTESHTAYYLNFHREMEGMVAGHTKVAAETGSGKTTIICACIAQADKAEPRVIWFDNRNGAEIFIRAMGGRHTTLSTQRSMHWNPFQLPDTAENRGLLLDLLKLMRACYSYEGDVAKIDSDDIASLQRAVDENYRLKNRKERRFRNIAWCFDTSKSLREAMALWHSNGANAGIFDNEEDLIDFTAVRHYCFEQKELMKGTMARPELPIMLTYLFHRMDLAMDGTPVIIPLDEIQNLVPHPFWQKKLDEYLMQIRRKNGIVITMSPDPKYLYAYTDAIKKQSVTSIYLCSPNATRVDMVDNLELTEGEFEFIRDTNPQERKFLIKRGKESVRAVFDLGSISQIIPVLSANDKAVALCAQVRSELGEDPEVWVPEFIRRSAAQNTHNLQRAA